MDNGYHIAGLGASAGGLDALREFFSNYQPCGKVSFVVVSHLPKNHNTSLDHLLRRTTKMNVELLTQNTVVKADHVYVLQGSHRVKIAQGVLVLRDRRDDEVINMAIDEFLHSLAEDCGSRAVAIIFAGMGDDGAKGAVSVHEHEGIVLVQDPATAAYGSMPFAAIKADSPNKIESPAALAKHLNDVIEKKSLAVNVSASNQ